MAGTARKNENSVAASRDRPSSRPPMIVAPERETPGNRIDSTWMQPMPSASFQGMSSRLVTVAAWRRRSISRMATPPSASASATGSGWKKWASIQSSVGNPTTTAGMVPMTRLTSSARDFASRQKCVARCRNFARYSHRTARMAPSWMNTVKAFSLWPVKRSQSCTRMRWPVEETGMNSVAPSTRPSSAAFNQMIAST